MLVLAGLGAAGATAATSPTGWAATATRAFEAGSAQLVGSAPAATPVDLVITLAPRDRAAEDAALRAMYTPGSPTYHRFLTPDEFAAEFAPTAAAVGRVTSYLSAQGFSDVSVLPDRMVVTAHGDVAQAEKAFHTSIARFQGGGLTWIANTTAASVPAALGGTVQAVLGLNNFPLATPHPATRQAGSPVIGNEVPPADFQNTYDAKGTPTGAGTSIAILTEGDISHVYGDLALAETKNHLPRVVPTQINVGPQSSDTSGQDEFDLDTQSSTAMAEQVAHLYLYNIGSLADAQIDLGISTFVAQDKAQAMSASLGGCDILPYLDGSMVSTDVILEEGAMQGQTFFASSGDNGDGCAFVAATGVPSSFPGTNWPASGEFTTAVGGTTLISDASANRVAEIGWIGSGGGISETENPGWWTQASDPAYDADFVTGGRAVPDVSLDADPNGTAAAIYVNGSVLGVGGTSLSSPLMLGAWARLETAHRNQLGFAPIDLYAVYDKVNPGTPETVQGVTVVVPSATPAPVPGFFDVTVGNNGLYSALPGYDEVTGIGTPDIAQLNKVLH